MKQKLARLFSVNLGMCLSGNTTLVPRFKLPWLESAGLLHLACPNSLFCLWRLPPDARIFSPPLSLPSICQALLPECYENLLLDLRPVVNHRNSDHTNAGR